MLTVGCGVTTAQGPPAPQDLYFSTSKLTVINCTPFMIFWQSISYSDLNYNQNRYIITIITIMISIMMMIIISISNIMINRMVRISTLKLK